MTTTQDNQESKAYNVQAQSRWCIDTQERSLSFVSPINFDAKFNDEGMHRGYELIGKVNMEAYIG